MGVAQYSGYEDGPPWKVGQSYPDFLACWTGVLSILAALNHLDRTGEGQWIEVGMYQIGVALIPEPILHYQLTGVDWERLGNRHRMKCPSNVYPAKGQDRWCAISIASDVQWRKLLEIMDRRDLLHDTRFSTAYSRRKHVEEVDALVAQWTRTSEAEEVMNKLQIEGISSGIVANNRDLLFDRQLRHRKFYEFVNHPHPIGLKPIIGRPFKFRFTEMRVQRHAPPFGEGNGYVLRDLLGYDEQRILELYERGIVADEPIDLPKIEANALGEGSRVGPNSEIDPDYGVKLMRYLSDEYHSD